MRSFATLLVLLLAPGLVLPAGFMVRICRCLSAATSAAAAQGAGCCSAPANVQKAQPSCCQHGCCSTGGRSDDGQAQLTARCCNCVWVTVPEPPPSLPQQAPACDEVALPPSAVAVVPMLLDTGHAVRPFAVARPPPREHHRNLPLRL
ncbi:MAG TPA: hypothetical protein VF384_19850 [Planctomycetota bacterium]